MKALSIMQPWAWLIVHGHKDIENRRWWTSYRGPVLIHAGKRHDGPRDEWDWPEIDPPRAFQYGGIVGEAEIVGCVTSHPSPWFQGPYGFIIRNARPLPFRPCRGQLGFFAPEFVERRDLLAEAVESAGGERARTLRRSDPTNTGWTRSMWEKEGGG